MNGRQAARAAAKRIEELEFSNMAAAADIRDYNRCIESMIQGGDPCEWCNDRPECERPEKEAQKGCEEWILRFRDHDPDGGDLPDESEGIFPVSATGGT